MSEAIKLVRKSLPGPLAVRMNHDRTVRLEVRGGMVGNIAIDDVLEALVTLASKQEIKSFDGEAAEDMGFGYITVAA